MGQTIKDKQEVKRGIDFTNLKLGGGIGLTDIDCYLEVSNKLFLFIEVKEGNRAMPTGQRIAYTRLVDAVNVSPDCHAYGIKAHWDRKNCLTPSYMIDLAKATVDREYHTKGWQETVPMSVRDYIDILLSVHVPERRKAITGNENNLFAELFADLLLPEEEEGEQKAAS